MIDLKDTERPFLISNDDIFKYYLGDFNVGECILSPLRDETRPSFCIFYHKTSRELRWKDFGSGEYGDGIDLVKKLFDLSYGAAVKKITLDMQSGFSSFIGLSNKKKRETVEIQIKKREFSLLDLGYWEDYGIGKETLERYDVFSISHYWINDRLFYIPRNGLAFAYQFGDKFKIYQPCDNYKWIGNCDSSVLQGGQQLPEKGDLLILTKALKDVMVYSSFGINAVAPQSESIILNDEIIKRLKDRFNKVIVNFDNDECGKQSMSKYNKKYNLSFFNVPETEEIKDISDFRYFHGENKTKEFLNYILNDKT